jgi:DNA polymerase-1
LPAPAEPAGASPRPSGTPQTFAAARAAEARAIPFDVAAYQTVNDATTLQAWINRATEAGVVAFDTETTSLDPLQAGLVGVSLAVAPGEACYIPIGHSAGEPGLFEGGGLLPGQIGEAEAIALLKPLLEDPGVLKIGQNVKFDWHVFARRGVEVAPYDDTMLISYALDSGATNEGHGMDALSERCLVTRQSRSRRSPGPAATSSALPASRSTRRPPTPPRTPT